LQALISSADDQFVAFICKGGVLLGTPYEDNDSRRHIPLPFTKKRLKGNLHVGPTR
jgi:hypothetical protein